MSEFKPEIVKRIEVLEGQIKTITNILDNMDKSMRLISNRLDLLFKERENERHKG